MHTRKIIAVVIVGLIVLLTYKIVSGFRDLNKAVDNQLPGAYSLPAEYSEILSPKHISELKVDHVFRSKIRAPIAECVYNSLYRVIVSKINLAGDTCKFLEKDAFWEVDATVGSTYRNIGDNHYGLGFQAKKAPDSAHLIVISYNGKLIRTRLETDSIDYYQLQGKRLSISYNSEDSPVDIWIKNNLSDKIELLFLRRRRDLYLLAMIPDRSLSSPSDSLLWKIIVDK